MTKPSPRLLPLAAPFAVALACGTRVDAPPADATLPDAPEPAEDVTYFSHIKPLVEQKCLACHVEGGIAPFSLDTPEDVVAMASFLADTVEARTMPPWMPSQLSPLMRNDISLTDEQIDLFRSFAAAVDANPDAPPLGDPADAPPPVEPEGFPLSNPDVTATMSEPFTPRGIDTGEDEFRCFVVDIDVPSERALVGFRFLPGNDLVDHHAILTLYPKADLAAIQALDDAEEGAGWSCFGEDVPSEVSRPVGQIGAWTPGNTGVVAYPGTFQPVPADVVVVFSMHYNVANVIRASGEVDLERAADQSSLELYFAPDGEDDGLIRSFNLPRNLNPLLGENASPIPANAAAHTISSTSALADLVPGARAALEGAGISKVHATGVGAHGHLLLTHFEMIADEGGPDERVLLDIPAWDFNWQGQYVFVDAIELDIETPITVRCTYDNTPDNRARWGLDPVSVTVTSGESTGEEMCIGLLQIVPRDPTP